MQSDDKDIQHPSDITPPAGNMKGYNVDVALLKGTWAAGKCCLSQALKQALSFETRVVIRLSAYIHEHTTQEKQSFSGACCCLCQIRNKQLRSAVH